MIQSRLLRLLTSVCCLEVGTKRKDSLPQRNAADVEENLDGQISQVVCKRKLVVSHPNSGAR